MDVTVEDIRSELYLELIKIASFIDFLAIPNSSGDQIRLTLENLRLSTGDGIPTETYADQLNSNSTR